MSGTLRVPSDMAQERMYALPKSLSVGVAVEGRRSDALPGKDGTRAGARAARLHEADVEARRVHEPPTGVDDELAAGPRCRVPPAHSPTRPLSPRAALTVEQLAQLGDDAKVRNVFCATPSDSWRIRRIPCAAASATSCA